jgi:hypothetical protein
MSSREFNGFTIVKKAHYHSIMRDESIITEGDSRGKNPEFMSLTAAIAFLHNLLEDKNKKGIKIQEIENKTFFSKKGGIDPVKTMVLVNNFGEGRIEDRKLREVLVEFKRGNFRFNKAFKDVIPYIAAQVVVEEVIAPVVTQVIVEEVVAPVATQVVVEEVIAPVATQVVVEEVIAPVAAQVVVEEVIVPVAVNGISIIISDSVYGYVSVSNTFLPGMKTIFIETDGTDLFPIISSVIENRNASIKMLSNENMKAFDLRVLTHIATSLRTLEEVGLCYLPEEDFEILNKGITISEFEKKSEIFQEEMKELSSSILSEFRF